MGSTTFTTTDGVKLRSASQRRYVTFAIHDDSTTSVVKRTDSRDTAEANHKAAVRHGYLRVVTVDTASNMHSTDPAIALWDTADALSVRDGLAERQAAVNKALKEAKAAPADPEPTGSKPKAAEADAHKAAKAAKEAKLVEAPAATARPATGPRGELLERKGFTYQDGPMAGYVVKLPFREFETAKWAYGAPTGSHPTWRTVCVVHGTHTAADSATDAERKGARKARAEWCKGCKADARKAEAPEAIKVHDTPAVRKAVAGAEARKAAKTAKAAAAK